MINAFMVIALCMIVAYLYISSERYFAIILFSICLWCFQIILQCQMQGSRLRLLLEKRRSGNGVFLPKRSRESLLLYAYWFLLLLVDFLCIPTEYFCSFIFCFRFCLCYVMEHASAADAYLQLLLQVSQ